MRIKTKGIVAGALTLGTLTAIGLSSTVTGPGSASALDSNQIALAGYTEMYGAKYGQPINDKNPPAGCELMQRAITWEKLPSDPPFDAGSTLVWKWSFGGTDWDFHAGRDRPKWKISWYLCDPTVPTTTT